MIYQSQNRYKISDSELGSIGPIVRNDLPVCISTFSNLRMDLFFLVVEPKLTDLALEPIYHIE